MTNTWGNTIAGSIPRGRYTTAQVAEYCGRSVTTIRRWRKSGVLPPSGGTLEAGELGIHLYTDGDLQMAKRLAKLRTRSTD